MNNYPLNIGNWEDGFMQADERIDAYYYCKADEPIKHKHVAYYHYYIQLLSPVMRDECILQAECKPYGYILTSTCELPDYLIDRHKLVLIGRGHRKDKHIQERLSTYG